MENNMPTNTQKRIDTLERELKGAQQMLWMLANRKGGKITFTSKELDTVKHGGSLKIQVTPENELVVEAE